MAHKSIEKIESESHYFVRFRANSAGRFLWLKYTFWLQFIHLSLSLSLFVRINKLSNYQAIDNEWA